VVLDLEILTYFLHHLVVQIDDIIDDNFPGQPISANYFLPDEPNHLTPSHTSIRRCFDPFSEAVNGD